MMKSLVRLLETDVGFRTERLLTMDVSLAGEKYTSGENQAAFFEQVLQRLESLPVRALGGRDRGPADDAELDCGTGSRFRDLIQDKAGQTIMP